MTRAWRGKRGKSRKKNSLINCALSGVFRERIVYFIREKKFGTKRKIIQGVQFKKVHWRDLARQPGTTWRASWRATCASRVKKMTKYSVNHSHHPNKCWTSAQRVQLQSVLPPALFVFHYMHCHCGIVTVATLHCCHCLPLPAAVCAPLTQSPYLSGRQGRCWL